MFCGRIRGLILLHFFAPAARPFFQVTITRIPYHLEYVENFLMSWLTQCLEVSGNHKNPRWPPLPNLSYSEVEWHNVWHMRGTNHVTDTDNHTWCWVNAHDSIIPTIVCLSNPSNRFYTMRDSPTTFTYYIVEVNIPLDSCKNYEIYFTL